jgi:hypothetical protein
MATPPDFTNGTALDASSLDKIGLWRVTRVTIGNAVASVTVSNCFSADFDNYKILVNGGTASANNNLIMTLNGAATGYYGALIYGLSTGTAPLLAAVNNAASWPFMGYHTTGSGIITAIELLGPNLAKQTVISSVYYNTGGNGTFTGTLDNTTQHTGFTLTPTTGTLTGGTITVYGYNNMA